MRRRRVLDVYCCQGGAARGYENAGLTVLAGVDMDPQPRYPFPFYQADAILFLTEMADWIREAFDFIHTSPPCQHDSDCQRIMDNDHADLIGPTRDALERIGLPAVIENVGGAVPKLKNPVELCGSMFGLRRTYRHRYFETIGWTMAQPHHPEHEATQAKMGRAPEPGQVIQAVGNFSGVSIVRDEWGVGWMNRDGIREAIPPVYATYVGLEFLKTVVDREDHNLS